MELAKEVDDDAFFADLNKQISLLIMDDDDTGPAMARPSVSLQALSQAINPIAQSPFPYEQSCRRETKGTGVFIPQSSHPRRKNRQGKASFNTKSHRQQPDNSRGVSHHVYYNSRPPYDCFSSRRF